MIKNILRYATLVVSFILLVLGLIFVFTVGTTLWVGIVIGLGIVFAVISTIVVFPKGGTSAKTQKVATKLEEKKHKKRVSAYRSKVSVKPREGYTTSEQDVKMQLKY